MSSKIVICEDLEFGQKEVVERVDSKLKKIFFRDEFKIDDAHEVTSEAYISEESKKYIFISAKSFNIFAQNSLLKLLEEPPRNIVFILIVRSKSVLLPTIRSRLPLEVLRVEKAKFDIGLNLKSMDFSDIFAFLKEHRYMKKDDLKLMVQAIVSEAILELGIDFIESELEMIDRLLFLSELNSRAYNILSYLLLLIHRKRNDKALKQQR